MSTVEKKKLMGKFMTNEWRKYYGVNNNTSIYFWFDKVLNFKNLFPYKIPSQREIKKKPNKRSFFRIFFQVGSKKNLQYFKEIRF